MRSSQQYFWYSFNRYHIYYIYSGLLLMIGWPDLSWSNGSSWNHLSYVHLFDTFYIFLLPFLSLFLVFFFLSHLTFSLTFSLTVLPFFITYLSHCLSCFLPFFITFLSHLLTFFPFSHSFLTFLSHLPFLLSFLT